MKLIARWLLEEWREHRWIFLGLLAALFVLDAGVLALWTEDLRTLESPQMALLAGPPALVLFLVVIGGQCFARERERGSLALLQRLPGGLRASVAAKLTWLVLGAALSWTLQAVCFGSAWALHGESAFGLECSQALLNPSNFLGQSWAEPGDWSLASLVMMATLPLAFLATALASSLSRRGSGAAFLGLIVVFGGLALAVPALRRLEPAVDPDGAMLRLVSLLTLGLFVALVVAVRRGLRFGNRVGPGLVASGAVLFGTALLGGGGFALAVHEHLQIDPRDKSTVLGCARLTADGQHLLVNVERPSLWASGRQPRHQQMSNAKVWEYDLEGGSWSPAADDGMALLPAVTKPAHSIGPQSLIQLVRFAPFRKGGPSEEEPAMQWWQSSLRRPLKGPGANQPFPDEREEFRQHLVDASVMRDQAGRRVAVLRHSLLREDGTETPLRHEDGRPFDGWDQAYQVPGGHPVPGGWLVFWVSPTTEQSHLDRGFLDVETGLVHPRDKKSLRSSLSDRWSEAWSSGPAAEDLAALWAQAPPAAKPAAGSTEDSGPRVDVLGRGNQGHLLLRLASQARGVEAWTRLAVLDPRGQTLRPYGNWVVRRPSQNSLRQEIAGLLDDGSLVMIEEGRRIVVLPAD